MPKPKTSSTRSKQKNRLSSKPLEAILRFNPSLLPIVMAEMEELLNSPVLPQSSKPRLEVCAQGILLSELSYRGLMELGYRLSTVRDVFWILKKARVGSIGEIKKALDKFPWNLLLEKGKTFKLKTYLTESHLTHSGAVEKAISKTLESKGMLAATGSTFELLFEARIERNYLRFSLSTAGETLSHRHYKKKLNAEASIREDLAAAFTLLSLPGDFWPQLIYAPFAGSGTLAFEAILRTLELPPSTFRQSYAIDSFLCTPQASRKYFREQLAKRAGKISAEVEVLLIEKEAAKLEPLAENLRHFRAGLQAVGITDLSLEAVQGNFFDYLPPGLKDKLCFMPINPPFGLRLESQTELSGFYQRLGRRVRELKEQASSGLRGFVLVPNNELLKAYFKGFKDLPTSPSEQFVHGGRKVFLVKF